MISAEIAGLMFKSHEKIRSAQVNLDNGFFDDAVSRAYYAVFHAVSALLLTRNLIYSSHSQLLGSFNKEFLKTKIFPTDFSRWIYELFDLRQTGDYDPFSIIDLETAKRCLDHAVQIVGEIEKHLPIS